LKYLTSTNDELNGNKKNEKRILKKRLVEEKNGQEHVLKERERERERER